MFGPIGRDGAAIAVSTRESAKRPGLGDSVSRVGRLRVPVGHRPTIGTKTHEHDLFNDEDA